MPDFYDNGNDDEEQDDSDSEENESQSSADSSKSTDKRVSDLQSKFDKETARANKLQKQLDALTAAEKEDGTEARKSLSGGNASTDNGVLDVARMLAYQTNPKLADYGVAMSDLNGSTAAEIVANAAALVAQFEKVETRIKNKVLADNGLAPDISDTPPPPKRDIANMSSEDFTKLYEAAMRGEVR